MKIGINCLRTAPGYKGGVHSFTFGLLDGFAASRRGHEFVIFAAPYNREMFQQYASLPNFRVIEINEWHVEPNISARLRQIARNRFNWLPWKAKLRIPLRLFNKWLFAEHAEQIARMTDVQFVPYVPSTLFPYPTRPTVYSIHDLQHVHFPQFFSEEQRLERKVTFASCVQHAALIQASSKQMRDDFLANFPCLTRGRIVVIREGVNLDAFEHPPINNDVQARHGIPENFLFYPAQLWHHKNHITILKALLRLKHQGTVIPLVLTGAKYSGAQHLFDFIKKNDLGDQVFHLGAIPYEDIIALHHAARFLITASLFESSSLPILEAAAAGTAIIASRMPSHQEHAEELEMQMFEPTDDGELANLLTKIWNDSDLIRRQVDHNKTAIPRSSWNSVAEDYLDAFESLIPERR